MAGFCELWSSGADLVLFSPAARLGLSGDRGPIALGDRIFGAKKSLRSTVPRPGGVKGTARYCFFTGGRHSEWLTPPNNV